MKKQGILNGLYFNLNNQSEKTLLTLVGTDGHRLAKFSFPLEKKLALWSYYAKKR